ncbi:AraC family transcriptional regulator [Paenibacillus sp. P26]|nr:AraC family transcriptional regulator [Paenibacillus sp. P26]
MNTLEKEVRNHLYPLKQSMLRRVVRGTRPALKKGHFDKLVQSGITFDFHRPYRLAPLRIDNFMRFREERGSDATVYKFAIMNISSEICSSSYRVETVDLDDDSVLLLLNLQEAEGEADESLPQSLLRQVQHSTLEYLKIGLSVTFSPVGREPSQLPALHKQVKEASLHRLFHGHGPPDRCGGRDGASGEDLRLSGGPGQENGRCADGRKCRGSEAALAEIVQGTESYPIHILQWVYSNLATTVGNVAATIQRNGSIELTRFQLYTPSLEHYETVREINELFYSFFDEISSKLTEKRSMRHEELIRKINDLIESHYADPNLCLNRIADELDMSPIYISRVYKQHTLTAIGDVINGIRLQKTKELLEQTSLPVADIAEQIGYTSELVPAPDVQEELRCHSHGIPKSQAELTEAAEKLAERKNDSHAQRNFFSGLT